MGGKYRRRRREVEGLEVYPHLAHVVVVYFHVVRALQTRRLPVQRRVDEDCHLSVGPHIARVH